jgi:hypothetical protein
MVEPADIIPDAAVPRRARRCIATGSGAAADILVRFVVGPDGMVVPDVGSCLPGRGMWLRADRQLIESARRRRLFAKAARAAVTVPDDLAVQVERQLVRRCVDLLALARRAGQAVGGLEKTKAWLASGAAGLWLSATDGGTRECARVARLAGDIPRIAVLTADELGIVFARGRTVHAAVAVGRFAEMLGREAARLAGLRRPGESGVAVARMDGDGSTGCR